MRGIAPQTRALLKVRGIRTMGGGEIGTMGLHAELRALLRCALALRRLRAAGGGWDVDARYEADQALDALRRARA